ncbi:TRIPC-like protein, partial [Mya arenaria]
LRSWHEPVGGREVITSPGIAKRTRSRDRQSEEKDLVPKKAKFQSESPSSKKRAVGSNTNQNRNSNPAEGKAVVVKKRGRSASGTKSKSALTTVSETAADRRRSKSESSVLQKSLALSQSGICTSSSFDERSKVLNSVLHESKTRRKSGSKSSGQDLVKAADSSSIAATNCSSRSSVLSVKSRKSSGSSVVSHASSDSLIANCEKCRKEKKSGKRRPRSTSSWTVTDSTSATQSQSNLSETSKASIKHCLRASTQAQSRAEVGTYRISRKRTKATVASPYSDTFEPATKLHKLDKLVDVNFISERKIDNNTNQDIQVESLPASFLVTVPGTSYPRVKDSLSGEKKLKEKKRRKEKRKKSDLGEGPSERKTNSSVPPEPKSLRRKHRARKTGSCASSSGRQSSTASKRHSSGGSSRSNTATTAAAPGVVGSAVLLDPSCSNFSGGLALPQSTLMSDGENSVPTSTGGGTSKTSQEENTQSTGVALLEARGLPSQLFGALGPRMHQLLHRTMGSNSSMNKAQQLLQGIQATGNEDQQLSSVIEMCQMLVMGNEDTLAGFPVKQVVPALISLLQMEHNFDMMNHACRALTYMMEALPRSSAVVVDAVPVFLEKLQVIQCMDVAEQALTALESLSRKHSKSILQARCALAITANCVLNMTSEEFHYIRDSVPMLSSRLSHQDKRSVESVCLCFARLVDNFQNDRRVLKEIAVQGLLTYIQQLLVVSPPVISTGTFVMVIRMLAIMCGNCPDLAVVLLRQKVADTLCYLLVGTSEEASKQIELVSRTPQELELLPVLPGDGIFSIDALMRKGSLTSVDAVCWQWKDDRNLWHNYSPIDSKIIEAAHQSGEDEVSLSTFGRAYTLDFNTMQQINEDTGTARAVQRKTNQAANTAQGGGSASETDLERCDSRAEVLREDSELASAFIKTLFAVLYEVYSSSAGPTVRHNDTTCSAGSAETDQRESDSTHSVSDSGGNHASQQALDDRDHGATQMRLSDVLKRKKPPKRPARKGSKNEESPETSVKSSSNRSRGRLNSKEKGSSGSSSKMSFLPSLNPRSWGKLGGSSSSSSTDRPLLSKYSVVKQAPPAGPNNKDKIKIWIKQQAIRFLEQYFSEETKPGSTSALSTLNRLCAATDSLTLEDDCGLESLTEISVIMRDSDVSPFEVIHSGLVNKLLLYLTTMEGAVPRDVRIRRFLHVFLNCPSPDIVYMKEVKAPDFGEPCSMLPLVQKLMACLHQLEQFQVKVHDLPGGSATSGRGSNALKFFNTHQLKEADDDGSDDDSDEDVDDTMARHRLEFLIGDHVLPYNMTVYQAIRQYSNCTDREGSETDTDSENPVGHASVWVQTHTIWYRPAPDGDDSIVTSPKKTKSEQKAAKTSHKKKTEELWTDGNCPGFVPALNAYLTDKLPAFVTVQDPSLDVIALLRILHAFNRCWATVYEVPSHFAKPVLPKPEFISSKLMAKANRQLQDPLVIMTGNLPSWLAEIAAAAPFLFPFDTRQLLFYATTFDRDRALMRLQDNSVDNSSNDSSDRVAPRLDKRKRVVNRVDLLKQAEKVMEDLASSRAMLEIQYENEVGTGLGPTLEFYALVSKELQRSELEMWRGDVIQEKDASGIETGNQYMYSPCGLFLVPLARNTKAAVVNKIKTKTKFLGKLMAKSLMDSRMWLLGQEHSLTSSDLSHLDPGLARSFSQLEDTEESRRLALGSLSLDGCSIEDLDLDFTLPGYPNIELKKGGKDRQVTLENLEEYLQLVTHWSLVEGVSRQFESLREGFESVFPVTSLQSFYPEELEQLFCGNSAEVWDVKTLMECCRPDHGYNHDSRAVRFLYEVLASYSPDEQRLFLQIPESQPRSHHREEELRVHGKPRQLPAICDDLRQLSQTARLFYSGGDARKTGHRCQGRTTLIPLVMIPIVEELHTLRSESSEYRFGRLFNF